MSTGYKNFFFTDFGTSQEQNLLESLIVESISIFGQEVLYIPRTYNNLDPLFTADDQSSYTQAFPTVMYIESFDKFNGDGDIMSKMGLEIKDQIVFSIAQRIFAEDVGVATNQIRPNEGDLIYFKQNQKVFQIKFVDKFQMFFQLGKVYTWKMITELFEYSDEVFSTGIPEIDSIQPLNDTNIIDWVITDTYGNYITDENGNYIVTESFVLENQVKESINDVLSNTSNQIIKFSPTNPFGE